MIEIDYNGSTYKYDQELGSRPWVHAKTSVAVPISLYANLRKTAIDSGVDASVFNTSGSATKKSKPSSSKSKVIKIF